MEINLQKNTLPPESDEERVRDFQRKLYQKAKQERRYRFYVLYDKIKLPYMLRVAYYRCRANKGAAGMDGITFEKIENEIGIGKLLHEIREELEKKSYKPQPVLRVYILKANGKMRPLGIPRGKIKGSASSTARGHLRNYREFTTLCRTF